MSVSVFIATSLDGFIARTDGALDWLPAPSGSEDFGYAAFVADIDAIVMGRKTFETVLGFGVWPYGSTPVVVLTGSPAAVHAPQDAVCEAMRGTPADIVAQLAERGLTRLYIDGGVTIQRFLAAGLVDRLIVTRVPVLLGAGIPLFGALPHDLALEHVLTRAFDNGLVQSEYRVRPFVPSPS